MNERITELMLEAGRTIPGDKNIDADFCNKFAELIIRECVELFPLTFTNEQYQRRIDKTIMKHFGIDNKEQQ